jgi:hypothetical protein
MKGLGCRPVGLASCSSGGAYCVATHECKRGPSLLKQARMVGKQPANMCHPMRRRVPVYSSHRRACGLLAHRVSVHLRTETGRLPPFAVRVCKKGYQMRDQISDQMVG